MTDPLALHLHRGTRAVQRMVEHAPASGGLALWVHHTDQADHTDHTAEPMGEAASVSAPVTTDGHTLRYRPAFERLPLPAQTGLVAHAVLHIALRHAQRYLALQAQRGDVDLKLFNTCADAIVNSALGHLAWLELPASALRLERLVAVALGRTQSAEAALVEWDVERLYRAIDDRAPPAAGGRSAQQPQRSDGPRAAAVRQLGADSPADLAPGADTRGPPESEAEQARDWRERLLRAQAGDDDHALLRQLLADLPSGQLPWEQLLRTQLARALSTRRALSWSRPARSYIANQGRAGPGKRLPFEPSHSGQQRVPRLVVVVDVSGSIDEALMARFAREIEAITRRQAAGLTLVIGDDQVRLVSRHEPGRSGLRDIRFTGGGGTDFSPLLEEADRQGPDLTVVLTDLDGPALYRPHAPVLWVVTAEHAQAPHPFGRKLCLD